MPPYISQVLQRVCSGSGLLIIFSDGMKMQYVTRTKLTFEEGL